MSTLKVFWPRCRPFSSPGSSGGPDSAALARQARRLFLSGKASRVFEEVKPVEAARRSEDELYREEFQKLKHEVEAYGRDTLMRGGTQCHTRCRDRAATMSLQPKQAAGRGLKLPALHYVDTSRYSHVSVQQCRHLVARAIALIGTVVPPRIPRTAVFEAGLFLTRVRLCVGSWTSGRATCTTPNINNCSL